MAHFFAKTRQSRGYFLYSLMKMTINKIELQTTLSQQLKGILKTYTSFSMVFVLYDYIVDLNASSSI